MKVKYTLMLLIWLVCVSVAGYAATQSVHDDYYKTGTLNWQNTGVYNNRHTSLFVNIDQANDSSTYVWIGRNTEIDGLHTGDNVSVQLAFTNGKYIVVDIKKLEGGGSEV
ncbi:MAG: hypothetical protein M0R51_15050 [Clostridia bacterium]|nr:hypothetical protein [Clostridia bacterium]